MQARTTECKFYLFLSYILVSGPTRTHNFPNFSIHPITACKPWEIVRGTEYHIPLTSLLSRISEVHNHWTIYRQMTVDQNQTSTIAQPVSCAYQ